MKRFHKQAALLLCVFIGLFFILQTGAGTEGRRMEEKKVSLQSVQMVFRSSAVKLSGKTQNNMRVVYIPEAALTLCTLLEGEPGSILAAMRSGGLLISFLLCILHIIYQMDGKKRDRYAFIT